MLRKYKGIFAALLFTVLGFSAFAAENTQEAPKKMDVSKEIFGHIGDSHEWHFLTIGDTHVSIPLPVILYSPSNGLSVFSSSNIEEGRTFNGYKLEDNKVVTEDGSKVYDFSITKNVTSMLVSVLLLFVIMFSVAKRYKTAANQAPKGMQNAVETVIVFVRDEVAKPNIGVNYMKYMPLLLTIFFFIWINNLLGLLPSGANFTGNIAVTGCLALIAFIVMIFTSKKYFWSHLFNPPGMPFFVKVILVPIEIISLMIKPVALMIRLFANMLAGHIVIVCFVLLIFIFAELNVYVGSGFSIISVALSVFSMLIESLVTAIQAFIFANLMAVFIGQMVEEHHHDSHDKEHSYNFSDSETQIEM